MVLTVSFWKYLSSLNFHASLKSVSLDTIIKFPLPLSEQGGPKHTGAVSGSLTICWPKIKVPLFVFLIRLALGAAGTLPLRKTPLYLQGTLVKATLSLIVTNRKGRQILRTQVFVVVAFHSPLKMKPNLLSWAPFHTNEFIPWKSPHRCLLTLMPGRLLSWFQVFVCLIQLFLCALLLNTLLNIFWPLRHSYLLQKDGVIIHWERAFVPVEWGWTGDHIIRLQLSKCLP